MKAGMPVCIGYFSVSFGFGAMAVAQGLSAWYAILISATKALVWAGNSLCAKKMAMATVMIFSGDNGNQISAR